MGLRTREQAPELVAMQHSQVKLRGITLSDVLDDVDIEVGIALGLPDLRRREVEEPRALQPPFAEAFHIDRPTVALDVTPAVAAHVPGGAAFKPLQFDDEGDRRSLDCGVSDDWS